MQDECTGVNALLKRKPFKGNVHISVANVHTRSADEQREIIECLSGLMVGETFLFNPVRQKSVGADGQTTMRSLGSLEREYYWHRTKNFFVSGVLKRFVSSGQ